MRRWVDVVQDLFLWVITTASLITVVVIAIKFTEALVQGKCSIW